MHAWLQGITQKVALSIVASLAPITGLVCQSNTVAVLPPAAATSTATEQLASVSNILTVDVTTTPPFASSTDLNPTLTPTSITPDLLPKVHVFRFIKHPTTTIVVVAPKPAASIVKTPPAPVVIPALHSLTAQNILDKATLSFKENRDGSFVAIMSAKITNALTLTWKLGDATAGGVAGAPLFNASFSCDPPADVPPPDALSQIPSFRVRTAYNCSVSLAAVSGTDQRAISKNFSFTTNGGPLVVTPAAASNVLLVNDKNTGGFTFDNEDTRTVTLTDVDLDITFRSLNVQAGPLVLRFLDGTTEQVITDYHLEEILEDPATPYTHHVNVTLPLTFQIGGQTQKLLAIQVLGVQKMAITGVDPFVKIIFRGIKADPPDTRLDASLGQLLWTCITTDIPYDPNATTGPFATGQACRN